MSRRFSALLRPPPGRILMMPPPVKGWSTERSKTRMDPEHGVMLRNFFPQPDYVEIRKGDRRHATTESNQPVETLLIWQGPTSGALFAAAAGEIFDVTPFEPLYAPAPAVEYLTNDRWQWTNFATTGGNFLWACNGADVPIAYDGSTWTQMAITGDGFSPEDAINVSAHKGRLWLTIGGTTKAVYLTVGAIQGAGTVFDIGGLLTKGGHLVAIGSWSLDGGAGMDDLLVFISSEGQAVIYQGTDPSTANTWAMVGIYDIGKPIGRRCLRQFGAELAVITEDGVLPLSQAMVLDRSESQRIALTSGIRHAMNTAAQNYGHHFGWEAISYPRGGMAILNVPIAEGEAQRQFVMNANTGAWCEFRGWDANCWAVFGGRLFYGGNDGYVYEADLPGTDEGRGFTALLRTAWSDYRAPGRIKAWRLIQPQIASNLHVNGHVRVITDFTDPPAGGMASSLTPGSGQALWGDALWDEALWAQESLYQREWRSVGGTGRYASIEYGINVGAPSTINGGFAEDDRFSLHCHVSGFGVSLESGGWL